MDNTFYITTTLPYVNSDPHLGFALEIVHADIIARYQTSLGKEVFFNTGTDEHGIKIYRKAQEQGKDAQAYVDEYAEKFRLLKDKLNLLSGIHFIRTTDAKHKAAAQEFWKRCLAAGDIYKKLYQIKYCIGCELEKTDSELVEARCPLHPNLELEIIDEENYFFKFSRFQKPLLDVYGQHTSFVVPDFRFNEIKKFVEAGLQDFSISRLREKMPWGVPVPGDDSQVMYVWFDALINYISTLGWPEVEERGAKGLGSNNFEKFWGTRENPNGVQIAGKDNLRQQSAMWQAMLMSAGLPNSKQVIIHGFITSGGQKMSKSLGNVIDPYEVVEKYGTDALRYWLAREMNTFEDGDFTWERFKELYTANLVNGLGNLVSRVLTMAVNYGVVVPKHELQDFLVDEYNDLLMRYRIQEACDLVWKEIQWCDQEIQKWEPFKLIKTDPDKAKEILEGLLVNLSKIAYMLRPILPETSQKMENALANLSAEQIPHLFPRIV